MIDGFEVVYLGLVPYAEALEAQRERREAVIAGAAPPALWLLEHPPTITLGRRAVEDLPDEGALAAAGLSLFRTERGGLATYHGPGQLVGYLIADVATPGIGVQRAVSGVEDGLIAALGDLGIAAHRRPGFPGAWVGSDKIAAIGLHFRKGVSMHGFALNLDPDLTGFAHITPCGIRDGGVTSVARLRGSAPSPRECAIDVGERVLRAIFSPSA